MKSTYEQGEDEVKIITISAVALMASTTPSVADNLSFNGPYIGIVGSYSWNNVDFPGVPAYPAGTPRPDLSGAMIGLTAGYNYRVGNAVVGIEADYMVGKISSTERDGNYLTEDYQIDGLGTVRARLGYVAGDFMPFVTGGVAFERLTIGQQCPDPAAVPFGWCRPANGYAPYDLHDKQWQFGYVIGGGLEWAASDKITLKGEVLYTDFGTETFDLGKTPSGKSLSPFDIKSNETLVRFGAAVRF